MEYKTVLNNQEYMYITIPGLFFNAWGMGPCPIVLGKIR
jgi:hypothetical protein